MELFEKISKAASKTYKATTEKTAKIAKETKLKINVNDCKKEITDKYKEIGEMVYQKSVLGEEVDKEELKAKCEEIDALTQQIVDFKNEILTINDRKNCPNCHLEIEISSRYCPECGFEQPKIELVQEHVEEEHCNCGECHHHCHEASESDEDE
ncbi:MAG: hypothetical protein HFJ25_05900 [Clostridia bacterium]|nr:hypothetical protein [Clostridia bacterium]